MDFDCGVGAGGEGGTANESEGDEREGGDFAGGAFASRSLIGLTLLEVSCSNWSEGGIVFAQDDLVFLPSWCLSLLE